MGGDASETSRLQEEESQYGTSMLPVCLQPRRIIDRVYGLVGSSRPSGSRPKQRSKVKAYFAPVVQGTQDDSDNCGTSMKTDSKIESGDGATRPGRDANAPDQEAESKKEGGPHDADEETTSPDVPAALEVSPNIRLPAHQPEQEERDQTIMGPFGTLQPMEDCITATPSAPPLPCGETSGFTSTTVQGNSRTLGSNIDRQTRARPHRFSSASLAPRSSDRSSDLGFDFGMLPSRKRRAAGNTSASGPRTRLGNVVGGYSATRFPSDTHRICPPSTRTSWRSSNRYGRGSGPSRSESHVFDQSLPQIKLGNQNLSGPNPAQYQDTSRSGRVPHHGLDISQPDGRGSNDPAPAALQNQRGAGMRLVPPGLQDSDAVPGRNNRHGLGCESLPSRQAPAINVLSNTQHPEMISNEDNEQKGMLQERVGSFGKKNDTQRGTADAVSRDDSIGQSARDVHGASVRLRDLELEVERLSKFEQLYENEVLCQICWEKKRNAVALPCSHFQYCQECLERHWQEKSTRECPLCRQLCLLLVWIKKWTTCWL